MEVYVYGEYGGEAPHIYLGTDVFTQFHQCLIAVNLLLTLHNNRRYTTKSD